MSADPFADDPYAHEFGGGQGQGASHMDMALSMWESMQEDIAAREAADGPEPEDAPEPPATASAAAGASQSVAASAVVPASVAAPSPAASSTAAGSPASASASTGSEVALAKGESQRRSSKKTKVDAGSRVIRPADVSHVKEVFLTSSRSVPRMKFVLPAAFRIVDPLCQYLCVRERHKVPDEHGNDSHAHGSAILSRDFAIADFCQQLTRAVDVAMNTTVDPEEAAAAERKLQISAQRAAAGRKAAASRAAKKAQQAAKKAQKQKAVQARWDRVRKKGGKAATPKKPSQRKSTSSKSGGGGGPAVVAVKSDLLDSEDLSGSEDGFAADLETQSSFGADSQSELGLGGGLFGLSSAADDGLLSQGSGLQVDDMLAAQAFGSSSSSAAAEAAAFPSAGIGSSQSSGGGALALPPGPGATGSTPPGFLYMTLPGFFRGCSYIYRPQFKVKFLDPEPLFSSGLSELELAQEISKLPKPGLRGKILYDLEEEYGGETVEWGRVLLDVKNTTGSLSWMQGKVNRGHVEEYNGNCAAISGQKRLEATRAGKMKACNPTLWRIASTISNAGLAMKALILQLEKTPCTFRRHHTLDAGLDSERSVYVCAYGQDCGPFMDHSENLAMIEALGQILTNPEIERKDLKRGIAGGLLCCGKPKSGKSAFSCQVVIETLKLAGELPGTYLKTSREGCAHLSNYHPDVPACTPGEPFDWASFSRSQSLLRVVCQDEYKAVHENVLEGLKKHLCGQDVIVNKPLNVLQSLDEDLVTVVRPRPFVAATATPPSGDDSKLPVLPDDILERGQFESRIMRMKVERPPKDHPDAVGWGLKHVCPACFWAAALKRFRLSLGTTDPERLALRRRLREQLGLEGCSPDALVRKIESFEAV